MPYRAAGEPPTTGRSCPRCKGDLVAETMGPNTLERCPDCFGIWIAAREFNNLLLDLDRQEAIREREEPHFNKKDEPGYLLCPKCAKSMARTNFDRQSGILVDTCRKHGVWLDRGELRSIVGYLAKRMEATMKARDEGLLRGKGKSSDSPFTVMPQTEAWHESWFYQGYVKNTLLGMLLEIILDS